MQQACREGHVECLRYALSMIREKKRNNFKFASFLTSAIKRGHNKCASILLDESDKKDNSFVHELNVAVVHYNGEVIRWILNLRPFISRAGLWERAFITNDPPPSDEFIEFLLSVGVKPEDDYSLRAHYFPFVWCLESTRVLLGILRKRLRIPAPGFRGTGYPLPLGLIRQIGQYVWDSRQKGPWHLKSSDKPKKKTLYFLILLTLLRIKLWGPLHWVVSPGEHAS